ncbi:MAG: fucose isomerase [Bacteroidales bacterium]|nr:fucose isomerase [Bacteroidales bacterium]
MAYKKNLTFGIIIGTRNYFNSALAVDVRASLLQLLKKAGHDYVILDESETPTQGSMETREDGIKCARLFRANRDRIDGIIICLPNFGFEIGIINALDLAELKVPILVQACDDENDKVDLDHRRDAFCGKLSVCNNLYQYNIPFTLTTLHTCDIDSPEFAADLDFFAGVCRVVRGLQHARIGAIGTRPMGFQTCRASEKILQASGITVVPVDMSEIMADAAKVSDQEAKAKMEAIKAYAHVPAQYEEKLKIQAKFGVAVERWIAANEVDATAIQCWDSLEKNYGCAPCITMSMLSEQLVPSACETDIAGAVSMYVLSLASGQPAALLDWNNNFAKERNKCVCTHCGNFPKGFANAPLELGTLGVLGRQLGSVKTFGAVKTKVSEGDFSFFRISTDDNYGCIKAYLGEGEITNEPYGMDGCIAVTKVNNLQQLMRHICKNGYEHHVAMCRTHVADIIEEAVDTYLDWDLYRHE